MRPCSNCRSVETEILDQGLITRLVSTLGGEPVLHAWVCRTCRHVDFWIDEPATEGQYEREASSELDDEDGVLSPLPAPIPAT